MDYVQGKGRKGKSFPGTEIGEVWLQSGQVPFANLKHTRPLIIKWWKGLHVICGRVLELRNMSSVWVGAFKYKEEEPLNALWYEPCDPAPTSALYTGFIH